MAKKKKKSSKRNPEISDRNKRIALISAILIGGVSVFVGTAMGVNELDDRAALKMVPDHSPIVEIGFPIDEQGGSWMPRSERDRIERLAMHAAEGTSGLTLLPLEEVGQAIQSTGWSEGSPVVRWTPDGRVIAEVRWRRPAAVVREGALETLIDWSSNRLALQYEIGESNQFFFTNASAPAPNLGGAWAGTDLREGMALYRLLSENGLVEQVEGIDLGEGSTNGTLIIHTDRDARIIWGGGPDHVLPGEQPSSVKLNRLKTLFNRTGRIDAGLGLLDIRGPEMMRSRSED